MAPRDIDEFACLIGALKGPAAYVGIGLVVKVSKA